MVFPPTEHRFTPLTDPNKPPPLGVVLSGGGARAAYQVGALRALAEHIDTTKSPLSVIVGSSIGAINGLLLAAGLNSGLTHAIDTLENIWRERSFRNTFGGSASMSFLRAVQVAILQFPSPGPKATKLSIFDPTPLMDRIDGVISQYGGLRPEDRAPSLAAVAVMTTVEDKKRRPLLVVSSKERLTSTQLRGASFEVCYVDNLVAAHAFASAALPSVLPPIKLNLETHQVRLVDGGIADNLPVDPAVRLGAQKTVLIDISGKRWWFDREGKPHYTKEKWELESETGTYCLRPTDTLEIRNSKPFGPILKGAVGRSRKSSIRSLGPTWPIFKLLSRKLGDEIAYEVMSYVVVNGDYIKALIALGYEEGKEALEAATKATTPEPVG